MTQVKLNNKLLNVEFFNETAQYGQAESFKTFSLVLSDEYSIKTLDEIITLIGDDVRNINISYTYNGVDFNLIDYRLNNVIKQFDENSLFVSMEFQKN